MPGIFKLNSDNTIVLTPEAKQLCQILSTLDQQTFLYIIYVYNTLDSPYRLMPIADRKRIAKNRIWGKDSLDPEDNSRISDAIEEMRSICYNVNQVSRDVLLTKLSMLNDQLITANTANIKSIMDAIKLVEDKIEEIDEKMEKEINMITLKGGKNFSLIEMFIRNREAYTEKMKSYGLGVG